MVLIWLLHGSCRGFEEIANPKNCYLKREDEEEYYIALVNIDIYSIE